MRRLGAALLAFGLLAGSGCGTPALRILSPFQGQIVTWMPVSILLDMANDVDTGTLVVRLNGTDVTSEFTVAPGSGSRLEATAERVWADGLVLVGTNVLEAEVENAQGDLLVRTAQFETEGDPYADAVPLFSPGPGSGFGAAGMPGIVLGPPRNTGLTLGGLDVVSLGVGDAVSPPGLIQLEFVDNVVFDGPGPDFTVFENPFFVTSGLTIVNVFSEPGRVSVSQDGISWCTFSACQLDPGDAPTHPGCAGVLPVAADGNDPLAPHPSIPTEETIDDFLGASLLTLDFQGSGGDSFDLADLTGCTLDFVRFVEIEAADFVSGPVGPDNQGFDLDAIAGVNAVPSRDDDDNGIPDALE